MKWTHLVLACGMLVALGACSNSSDQEMQIWIAEQIGAAQPRITPLEEPRKFTPQPYTQRGLMDPFDQRRLTQAFKSESTGGVSSKLIDPELIRRKEPLEAYPLDAMTMVGGLQKGGQRVALIRVEKLLYQVRLGNYLGQNYGRVTNITETEVTLREIVQDGTGDWVERQATLQLQEKSK